MKLQIDAYSVKQARKDGQAVVAKNHWGANPIKKVSTKDGDLVFETAAGHIRKTEGVEFFAFDDVRLAQEFINETNGQK